MSRRIRHSSPEVGPNGELPSKTYNGITMRTSAMGGYILELTAGDTNLFMPDQLTPSGGRRGGCFATVPNFGPDIRELAKVRQSQHGYLRNTPLRTGRLSDSAVNFTHTRLSGEYSGLATTLTYRIGRSTTKDPKSSPNLYAGLTLYNDSKKEMRVAPGFHPYIDLSSIDPDKLSEIKEEFVVPQTVLASQLAIPTGDGREAVINSTGFERMTMWSGNDGLPYLCVEPNLAGASFASRPDKPLEQEMLAPGDVRTYEMSITWRPESPKATLRNKPTLRV